jgi:hypothetical protein
MRTIILQPTEFSLFQKLANQLKLWFTYSVINGMIYVNADSVILQELGY